PKREGKSIWLVFYDGEEAFVEWTEDDSLYGSRAFVDYLREKELLNSIEAVVNLDMIGDCQLGIFKDMDAPSWLEAAVWKTAREVGYGKYFTERPIRMEDDHVPLRE